MKTLTNGTYLKMIVHKSRNKLHYKISEICGGCKTFEDSIVRISNSDRRYAYGCCITLPFEGDRICPCSTCLIKMVCLNKCDMLNDYIAYVNSHMHTEVQMYE